jgi:hypothetical protein
LRLRAFCTTEDKEASLHRGKDVKFYFYFSFLCARHPVTSFSSVVR